MTLILRPARAEEAGILTALARAAKASHGYPAEWLTLWQAELQVTAEDIRRHLVLVADDAGRVVGFVGLEERPVGWWLEHLWVDPAAQTRGIGRALVERSLAEARARRVGPVLLVSDPGAAAFYEKLGARPLGFEPAPMPGAPARVLPRYEFPAPGGRVEQEQIYTRHAAEYDALVGAEDCEGNLLPALEAVARLDGAAVLEVGVGTGRLTRLLLPRIRSLVGVERAPALLERARRHVQSLGPEQAARAALVVADGRDLPVGNDWADLALAGWVFGHFRHWMPVDWRAQVGRALDEMERALCPGGALVLIETLGTGRETPAPPNDALSEYYAWLEQEQGMERRTLRTDYLFADVATAAAVAGFFFGGDFARRVAAERWRRIPECTGIWWRRGGGTA